MNSLAAWLNGHGFSNQAPSAANPKGVTPLMLASQLGEAGIVAELLAAGAEIGPLNSDGNNALWLACYGGNAEVIKLLIEAGIDLDHSNFSGSTCLMYASSAGKFPVVEQLLAAGADPLIGNQDDFTAVDLASNLECLQLLRAASRRHSSKT